MYGSIRSVGYCLLGGDGRNMPTRRHMCECDTLARYAGVLVCPLSWSTLSGISCNCFALLGFNSRFYGICGTGPAFLVSLPCERVLVYPNGAKQKKELDHACCIASRDANHQV
jgi:hypothetical protein